MPSSDDNVEQVHWFSGPLLKRLDQAAVAGLTAVFLCIIAGWWIAKGGQKGLVEIDRQPPQVIAFQVDINTAPWAELTLLPGVGETLARRIVESREQEGLFADHNDLDRVRGIGPKTLEQIRPYLLPMPAAETLVGQ